MKSLRQHTLAAPIEIAGIGVHSGDYARIVLRPAPIDSGIQFCRMDLSPVQRIPASSLFIEECVLCSALVKEGVRILTVEHLMSALAAWAIDNVLIEVFGPEIPILDGSSIGFWMLIRDTGVVVQSAPRVYWRILSPVTVSDGDRWARFEPCTDEQSFDIEVDFPHPLLAPHTSYHFDLWRDDYAFDVARARTFGFKKDLEYLRDKGLALGGSLSNAVLLDAAQVVNPEGFRYPDECLRHKLLDAIGDVYLLGHPFIGRFSAYKPGHALNNALVREILAQEHSCVSAGVLNPEEGPSTEERRHGKRRTTVLLPPLAT